MNRIGNIRLHKINKIKYKSCIGFIFKAIWKVWKIIFEYFYTEEGIEIVHMLELCNYIILVSVVFYCKKYIRFVFIFAYFRSIFLQNKFCCYNNIRSNFTYGMYKMLYKAYIFHIKNSIPWREIKKNLIIVVEQYIFFWSKFNF